MGRPALIRPKLDAEQQRIVEANMGLAWDIAKRYGRRSRVPYEDRVQAGILGLIYAIQGYDSSLGSLASYAGRAIRNAIRREITESSLVHVPYYVFAQAHRLRPEYKEAAARACKDPASVERRGLLARDPDPAQACEQADLAQVAIEQLDAMPRNDRRPIEASIFQDRTDAAIAAELGSTISDVKATRSLGLKRLRAQMSDSAN